MPLLIFHCRTRLFLDVVQQRTILSGFWTLAYALAFAGTVNELHIVSHHTFSTITLYT